MHCTTAHTQKEAKYTLVKAKQDEKVACVSERESVVYTECDFNNDESRSTQATASDDRVIKKMCCYWSIYVCDVSSVALYYEGAEGVILWEDLFLMTWPTSTLSKVSRIRIHSALNIWWFYTLQCYGIFKIRNFWL